MADEIQRLITVWDANFSKMDEKLNKMTRATYGAASKVEKRLDATSRKVDSAFSTIKIGALENLVGGANRYVVGLNKLGLAGVAAAVGIGAAVVALGQARAAAAFSDEIADTAKVARVTTDVLQEYRYMLRQLGGDAGQADEALQKFSTILGQAQVGRMRALRGFKELGFSDAQVKGMKDADEALESVIKRIEQLPDAQQDAAIKAFGLEGLKPAIQSGLEEMQRLRAEAHAIGVVMDADLIQKGAEAHDKFETLTQIIDIQLKSALIDLAPTLIELLGLAVDISKAFASAAHWIGQLGKYSPNEQYQDRLRELATNEARIAQVRSGPGGAMVSGMSGLQAFSQAARDREVQRLEREKTRLIASANAALAAGNPAPPTSPAVTPSTRTLVNQTRTGGAKKAEADRSDQALADARQAQVQAEQRVLEMLLGQMGLHEDRGAVIAELAYLEGLQIESRKLERDQRTADAKNLTAAAKGEIIASSAIVAEKERQALDLETARALADAEQEQTQAALETRREIQDSLDEMARVQAGEALTAKARQKLELEIFERSRELDRETLKAKYDYLVAIGLKTAAERAARIAAFDVESEAGRLGIRNDTRSPLDEGRKAAGQEGVSIATDIIQADDIEARYAAMYAAIDQMREKDTLSEEQAARAKMGVTARYTEERLAVADKYFGELATLSTSSNRTLATIGKAAAIAQATIAGIQAVQNALKDVPYPFNYAAAAAMAVVTAANVAKIAGVPGFDQGGWTGGQRGQVRGAVHGEEFVVKAGPAAAYRPMLEAINAGMLNITPSGPRGGVVHQTINLHAEGAILANDLVRTLDRTSRTYALTAGAAALRRTPDRVEAFRKLGT